MQHNITSSIIDYLRNALGMEVVWVYDGVILPDVKPFITVEQMPNDVSFISKGRTAQTIYRYQVGYHAQTASDRARRQDEIRNVFLFDEFELLDTTQIPAPVIGSFLCEVTAVTPISPEDISEVSAYHRVYFDVEIDRTFSRRG